MDKSCKWFWRKINHTKYIFLRFLVRRQGHCNTLMTIILGSIKTQRPYVTNRRGNWKIEMQWCQTEPALPGRMMEFYYSSWFLCRNREIWTTESRINNYSSRFQVNHCFEKEVPFTDWTSNLRCDFQNEVPCTYLNSKWNSRAVFSFRKAKFYFANDIIHACNRYCGVDFQSVILSF